MTVDNLRCGTKVRTAKGWFNIVRVWFMAGKVVKVDLTHNTRPIDGVDAEELCKHIFEVEII